jgi:hypothetical protein
VLPACHSQLGANGTQGQGTSERGHHRHFDGLTCILHCTLLLLLLSSLLSLLLLLLCGLFD